MGSTRLVGVGSTAWPKRAMRSALSLAIACSGVCCCVFILLLLAAQKSQICHAHTQPRPLMALDWAWILYGGGSFILLVVASWCVGEGGEILGKKYDASIIGGLVIAWLNTGTMIVMIAYNLTVGFLSPRDHIFYHCATQQQSTVCSRCSIGKFYRYLSHNLAAIVYSSNLCFVSGLYSCSRSLSLDWL